jgi:porin
VTLNAPFPSRPDDIVGIGVQAVRFSDDFNATADYEINTELFYRIQITRWFYIKPDVQYITNPGGQGNPDALAVTLRAQIDF